MFQTNKMAERIYAAILCTFLLFMLSVALTTTASAQEVPTMNVGIRWAAPTQYTDGTPIPAGGLAAYTILCGSTAADLSMTVAVGPTVLTYSRGDMITNFGLNFGPTYFCALTATATNGLTSARSAVVSFKVEDTRVPGAPVLTVE